MKIRLALILALLIFPVGTASAQTHHIRVTFNTNLRDTYNLRGKIVETAPAGTTLRVVGRSKQWLKIDRNGIAVWMADWVSYTPVETGKQTPSQTVGSGSSQIDNCCFVDRQCNSDSDWTDGYWAFQNGQCSAPSQTLTQTSAQPASIGQSQIDNCCFVDRQCNSDSDWSDGYWAFQNGQCDAPAQTHSQTPVAPWTSHGLSIEGSEAFIALITEALNLLRTRSQKWYDHVTSGADRIIEDEDSYTMGVLVSTRTILSAPYRRRVEYRSHWEAVMSTLSGLTHEACHIHRHEAGFEYGPYTKVSEELACIQTEKEMLRAIGVSPYPRIHGVIGPTHCDGSLENHVSCRYHK